MIKQLRKPKVLKNRIKSEKSKTRFECRVIKNPYELIKMGYTPSNGCWKKYHDSKRSVIRRLDTNKNRVLKKVA
jgi:hypothetical protein